MSRSFLQPQFQPFPSSAAMALTGGGFGAADFQTQLQTGPLTPDRAKKFNHTPQARGPGLSQKNPEGRAGTGTLGRSCHKRSLHARWRAGSPLRWDSSSPPYLETLPFSPRFPEVFRLSPNDLVCCGDAAPAGAGACSQQGRGLLADTSKDVPRSIP